MYESIKINNFKRKTKAYLIIVIFIVMIGINDYRKKIFTNEEYDKHISGEKKHFKPSMYKEDLTEKTPAALDYFLKMLKKRIKEQTGFNVEEHLISEVNKRNNFQGVTKF